MFISCIFKGFLSILFPQKACLEVPLFFLVFFFCFCLPFQKSIFLFAFCPSTPSYRRLFVGFLFFFFCLPFPFLRFACFRFCFCCFVLNFGFLWFFSFLSKKDPQKAGHGKNPKKQKCRKTGQKKKLAQLRSQIVFFNFSGWA